MPQRVRDALLASSCTRSAPGARSKRRTSSSGNARCSNAAARRRAASSAAAASASTRRRGARPRRVVRGVGAGQPLQQQAAHARAVGGEHQPAVDLLRRARDSARSASRSTPPRARRCPGRAGRRPSGSSVIARRAVRRRRRRARRARRRRQRVGGVASTAPSRAATSVGVAFDDEQAHRAVARSWTISAALELERRGEQRRRGEQLGEHALQRRRIGMAVEDLAARAVEAHQRAAHGGVLEHETRERVGERRSRGHAARPSAPERHRVERHRQRRVLVERRRRRRCRRGRPPRPCAAGRTARASRRARIRGRSRRPRSACTRTPRASSRRRRCRARWR